VNKKGPEKNPGTVSLSAEMAQVYQLMEASPIGMGISRLSDGCILYSNKRNSELFGLQKEEIVGETGRNLWVDPDQRDEYVAEFRRTGKVEEREVQLYRRWTEPFWCMLSWKSVDFTGEDCFVFWTYDISAQKLVENRMHESEQRFRDFTNTATDWFWELDENLCVTAMSEGYFELTGRRLDDLIGKARFDVIHSENMIRDPVGWQAHRDDMENHRPFKNMVILVASKNGQWNTTLSSGIPVFDDDGVFKGYRGVSNNVTEQTRAEERLRESEQRFRDFTNTASDWFWETGPDLRITEVSSSYYEFTGLEAKDIIGKNRAELVGPEKLAASPELWQPHLDDLENHRPFRNFEYVLDAPNGKQTHISLCATPVFGEEGEFSGYRGSGRDVTRQRQAEHKLAEQSRLFETALNSIDQGFVVWGEDNRLIICNDRFCELLDLPRDKIKPGKPLIDILRHLAHLGVYGDGGREALAQNRFREIVDHPEIRERQFTTATGRVLFIRRYLAKDLGWIATFTDVTDIVERERTSILLREAIETFPDSVILFDQKEQVVFSNDRYHEIYPNSPPQGRDCRLHNGGNVTA